MRIAEKYTVHINYRTMVSTYKPYIKGQVLVNPSYGELVHVDFNDLKNMLHHMEAHGYKIKKSKF